MRVPLHTPHPIHHMLIRFAAAAAAVLVLAAPVQAQDADSATAPNGLRPGAWSLSFAPSASERGEFGAWRMVGERTSVGLTLGFSVSDSDREIRDEPQADQEDEHTNVHLGIAARRYLVTTRSVAPYLLGRLSGGIVTQRRESAGYSERVHGIAAGAELAVGAEWFPVRQFSVAGHTGVRASVSRLNQDLTRPEGTETDFDAENISLGTFTSALSLQIYF